MKEGSYYYLKALTIKVISFDFDMLDACMIFRYHGCKKLSTFKAKDEVIEDEAFASTLVKDKFFERLKFMGLHMMRFKFISKMMSL